MQAKILANLNRTVSKFSHVKYQTGSVNRDQILDNLFESGYCLYRDTNLQNDLLINDNSTIDTLQYALFGDNYKEKLMGYEVGTDSRDKLNEGSPLLSVSKISHSHWVPYHNELLYTNEFPQIIAFICVKNQCKFGGHTPFTNTIDIYYHLPSVMRNKFDRFGITYIRNLRDRQAEQCITNNLLDLGGQKFMQDVFGTNDRNEIELLCAYYGYEYEWNLCQMNQTPILRIKYVTPAVVEYQFGKNIVRSFANSVTGMNGRYFTNYNDYYERLEYIDRPFHSQWGNGDEFTDEEYELIEQKQYENSIRFEWKDGDIFIADNLCWAHGRYPYEGERNIMVMMGEPYSRYPYMIAQKQLKQPLL